MIGVVLAGGRGRRIGGDKALVELEGRPLIAWPLGALAELTDELAVVAKEETRLPALPGVARWIEDEARHHPLAGVAHALRAAAGRDVLVCAVDLPLITPQALLALVAARERRAVAVVPRVEGRLQPLCALYAPAALGALEGAVAAGAAAIEAVAALAPVAVEVADVEAFHNVNAPADLLTASALLSRRRVSRRSRSSCAPAARSPGR